MGVPAAKVTDALMSARDELAYVLDTLRKDNGDIYEWGRQAIPEIVTLALEIRETVDRG